MGGLLPSAVCRAILTSLASGLRVITRLDFVTTLQPFQGLRSEFRAVLNPHPRASRPVIDEECSLFPCLNLQSAVAEIRSQCSTSVLRVCGAQLLPLQFCSRCS
jgi:hypothetical protein